MNKRAIGLSIGRMMILALGAALAVPARGDMVVREVFRDAARAALVDDAVDVEACILRVEDPSHGHDLNRRVFVDGRYQKLPEQVRALIAWKLLDDRNYTWDATPACILTWNARVRFRSGGRTLDVDFCFSCAVVRVLEGGVVIGGGYFESGSDWVFRALAAEFPKDPIVRALQVERQNRETNRLYIEMAKAREARKRKSDVLPITPTPSGPTPAGQQPSRP